MTFLTLQEELEARLRNYDLTIAGDSAKIKRWVNMGIQYICGKRHWPFMLAQEIVQTVPDITTGTVSVNAGDTALTFSSAPVVSVTDRYIKLSTSSDWYRITAHTAAVTTATMNPAYTGSANLTDGTYTIRKLLYATTTPLMQILDMKQLVTPVRIISQSPRSADFLFPLYYDAGMPYYYIMSSPDSSGTQQFSLMPTPSDVMNIMVRGIRALTDLSADGDLPLIPVPWHDGILNFASFYGFQSMDDTRAKIELELGELRIADMERAYSHDPGRLRIMHSVDEESSSGLQYALPSNFGPEA